MATNKPDFSLGRVDLPDVGGGFLDFSDRQQKQYQIGLANAVEADKLLKDQKRYEEERAWKLEDRAIQQDQYKRELAEKSATNEAISAILDPKKYQAGKIAAEQNAIEQSLSALSPADRVIAEQQIKANYNPAASGGQWLSNTMSNANADQSKVLSTKNSLLNMRLNDPNSEEYKAKQAADWAEYTKKQNYAQGLQTAAENRREAKENKKAEALFNMLNTPRSIDEVTTYDNQTNIDVANKSNKLLDSKATNYGEILQKRIAEDPAVKALQNSIDKLEQDVNSEKVKSSVLGGESSPQVKIKEGILLQQKKALDNNFARLDNIAKQEAGLSDNYQRQYSVIPELKETQEINVKKLSKDEWLKSAIPNAKDAGTTGFNTLFAMADKLYPEPDKKEVARLLEDKATAKDYAAQIESITGKPAIGSTKEALAAEYKAVAKKLEGKVPEGTSTSSEISKFNTGEGWFTVGNEREDVQEKIAEVRKKDPTLTDKQISAALLVARDSDGDFLSDMFEQQLTLEKLNKAASKK
jgi:hypothetical protein